MQEYIRKSIDPVVHLGVCPFCGATVETLGLLPHIKPLPISCKNCGHDLDLTPSGVALQSRAYLKI
jgi:hypothetical protein